MLFNRVEKSFAVPDMVSLLKWRKFIHGIPKVGHYHNRTRKLMARVMCLNSVILHDVLLHFRFWKIYFVSMYFLHILDHGPFVGPLVPFVLDFGWPSPMVRMDLFTTQVLACVEPRVFLSRIGMYIPYVCNYNRALHAKTLIKFKGFLYYKQLMK